MKKIIGMGNCLVDVLMKLTDNSVLVRLDLPIGSMQLIDKSEKERIDLLLKNQDVSRVPGGSAANTIKALAKAGVEVGFVGKIADDDMGNFFADTLSSVGVRTFLTRGEGEATGVANTFISQDGQRTFATYLGISGSIGVADVTEDMLRGYDYLYVEGYLVQNYALMDHVMGMAKAMGLKVCLDLASYNVVEANLEFFRHLLADYVDIVFANEEESKALTGKEPNEALEELGRMCEVAVVKLGSKGTSAMRGNEKVVVAAREVAEVVDTTGAGDYFAAGFLDAMIRQKTLKECLDRGGELAAGVIQVIGCPI